MGITFVSIMSFQALNIQVVHINFLHNHLSTRDEMCRLEQLFIENKFDPQDDLKPLHELLTIQLNKEVKKKETKARYCFSVQHNEGNTTIHITSS